MAGNLRHTSKRDNAGVRSGSERNTDTCSQRTQRDGKIWGGNLLEVPLGRTGVHERSRHSTQPMGEDYTLLVGRIV